MEGDVRQILVTDAESSAGIRAGIPPQGDETFFRQEYFPGENGPRKEGRGGGILRRAIRPGDPATARGENHAEHESGQRSEKGCQRGRQARTIAGAWPVAMGEVADGCWRASKSGGGRSTKPREAQQKCP